MAEAQAKLALHVDSRANQGSGVLNVCTDIHDGRNFKPPRHPGHRVFRAGAFFRPRWFSCWGRSHKKGAGVTARTLEDSSLNEPSANLGQGLRTKTMENVLGGFGPEGGVEAAALALAADGAFDRAALEHFGR